MYHKIHTRGSTQVLAVADKELLGKKLKEGKISLEVKEGFYKEGKISEDELRALLREHDNINLVGEKAVSAALKENLVDEGNVIKIGKIPHVQIFKI